MCLFYLVIDGAGNEGNNGSASPATKAPYAPRSLEHISVGLNTTSLLYDQLKKSVLRQSSQFFGDACMLRIAPVEAFLTIHETHLAETKERISYVHSDARCNIRFAGQVLQDPQKIVKDKQTPLGGPISFAWQISVA